MTLIDIMLEPIAKIYVITNNVNKKRYVGFTMQKVEKRLTHHIGRTRQNYNYHLVNSIRKHGWENFSTEVILESKDVEYMKDIMEPYFIKELNTFYENGAGYNMTWGGEGILGYKKTKKQREATGDRLRGKKLSPEHVEKLRIIFSGKGNPRYGIKWTPELREKIKIGLKNSTYIPRKWTEEQKRASAQRFKGRILSPDHIESIRRAMFKRRGIPGHPHTEEHKTYMSCVLKGRKFTPEHVQKLKDVQLLISAHYLSVIVSPDNRRFETYSIKRFADDFNLCGDVLFKYFNYGGKCNRGETKGWSIVSRTPVTKEMKDDIKTKLPMPWWREITIPEGFDPSI